MNASTANGRPPVHTPSGHVTLELLVALVRWLQGDLEQAELMEALAAMC